MTASYVDGDGELAGALVCPACGWVRAGDGCGCGESSGTALPLRWADVAGITVLVAGLVALLLIAAT